LLRDRVPGSRGTSTGAGLVDLDARGKGRSRVERSHELRPEKARNHLLVTASETRKAHPESLEVNSSLELWGLDRIFLSLLIE